MPIWILKLLTVEFFMMGIAACITKQWWLALYGFAAAALQISVIGGMK